MNKDSFLTSNWSNGFQIVDTLGNITANISNPDLARGLIMPTVFALLKDTICITDSIRIAGANIKNKTLYYVWGDGKIDTVNGLNRAHKYTASGSKLVRVLIQNGVCIDTAISFNVYINSLPLVTITGPSTVCVGASITNRFFWWFK
ncbi:MAG: hypothetical protein IPK03_11130 [Bacteroidetes bacterium]|nr:hypothetical protein [Bacteroidota bacterium]